MTWIVLLIFSSLTFGETRTEPKFKVREGKSVSVKTLDELKEIELGRIYENVEMDGDIRVEQRFETSMTVQNEGPHYDLTDWKHGYTKWVELKKEDGSFKILPNPQEDLPFPKVNTKEIQDYLKMFQKKQQIDAHWKEIFEKCVTPTSGTCAVGVSKIEFRVLQKDKKKVLRRFSLINPMGC